MQSVVHTYLHLLAGSSLTAWARMFTGSGSITRTHISVSHRREWLSDRKAPEAHFMPKQLVITFAKSILVGVNPGLLEFVRLEQERDLDDDSDPDVWVIVRGAKQRIINVSSGDGLSLCACAASVCWQHGCSLTHMYSFSSITAIDRNAC